MGNSFSSNDLVLSMRREKAMGQGWEISTLALGIAVCGINANNAAREMRKESA
jgi:hypothetical protein